MANGVNVKLGVSGVAQFKSAMKEAQTSVKTLDAELKLNEQQFRLTGDAETYMEQKSEILKRQIEQQKEVVRQAEQALAAMKSNGVNPTSQAFQQMQQNLLRAQGELVGMQADLNNVGTAGQEAASEVGGLQTRLDALGKQVSFKNLADGIDSITDKLKHAASAAWNLGKEIVNATLGAGEWADELATEAAVYGLEPEDLQRMRKTARVIDTDVETIINAQKRLKKEIAGHSAGFMGAYAEILPGYDPTQHDWEDVFWDTGAAIMAMADAEKQEAYAQQIFGRSWADLIPLFQAGREEYEKTNASWNVVSDDNLKKLGEMDDEYQKLSSEWETFQYTMLSVLAGPMTVVMGKLTEAMAALNEYLQTEEGQKMLDDLSQGLIELFESLITIKPEEIVKAFGDALNTVKGIFEWIGEHWSDIVEGIKAIGMAFAGIQLTSLAANLLTITQSLGWFRGGSTTTPTNTTTAVPAAEGTQSAAVMFGDVVPLGFFLEEYKQLGQGLDAKVEKYKASAAQYNLTPLEMEQIEKAGITPEEYIQMVHTPAHIGSSGGRSFWTDDGDNNWLNDGILGNLWDSMNEQKNKGLTPEDMAEFRALPAQLYQACKNGVESANIQVVIQDDAVQDLTHQLGNGLWSSTMNLLN